MGIARSTFYDAPPPRRTTPRSSRRSPTICDEFEFYGWRRVRAELRHRGLIVNHKKIRRLMREHDLQPTPTPPLCRDDRQRSRSADLSPIWPKT